jgi:RNA polymerase sigma-70 factor, ECF subfamily
MFECDTTPVALMKSETQQIALGLRQRDVALLQALVEQYQYRLVRYLIYLLGRRDGVDDLVQETWLRVLERGSSYDGRSRFEPWLFAIARNLAIDHMRKRRIFSLDSNDDEEWDGVRSSPASHEPSPFTLAARTEDAEQLALSLQTLEPIYREALVLRFQEDLSLQEMSAVVGAPVPTVASRIYRGLARPTAQRKPSEIPQTRIASKCPSSAVRLLDFLHECGATRPRDRFVTIGPKRTLTNQYRPHSAIFGIRL